MECLTWRVDGQGVCRLPLEAGGDESRQSESSLLRQHPRKLLFGKIGGAIPAFFGFAETPAAFSHAAQNLRQEQGLELFERRRVSWPARLRRGRRPAKSAEW